MTDYATLWHRLLPLYDTSEAQAIVRLLLDIGFGLSFTDVCCGKVTQLSLEESTALAKMMDRLAAGEPVQYVLGTAEFCGRSYCVNSDVLIPRPETEELCGWIKDYAGSNSTTNSTILDIGTGSGCIAVTLANDIAGAAVTAWDISSEALDVAKGNARRLGAKVAFEQHDILNAPTDEAVWSIVVSNPPYICEKEREGMCRNVLDYEPGTALFVPDNRPLIFYEAIAYYASTALIPNGKLFFEINPLYADSLQTMLRAMGYVNIEKRKDSYGKWRFFKAERP